MISAIITALGLISLILAVVAIGWLSIVSKHLSSLGKRVLESEDIGRVIQAADKTGSFESRIAGCENKTNESQNKLAEHETKLNELIDKLGASEQMINRHAVDLANTSEKMASFEGRFNEFENNVGNKLNNLPELETKVNELVTKLESVEEVVNRNGAGIAEADRSLKTLTSEIQSLEKFQTSFEKTRNLILAAFTDMRAAVHPEEDQQVMSQTAKTEEISQGPEDKQEQDPIL
jgi:chromosome segregation ATPase